MQDWDMHDGRLTTKEVARRLNLSAERVRQLANSGQLTCTVTDLGRLFDPADVEHYARTRIRYAHRKTPAAPS
jgi:excisionase family DNA binding protein